jgi:hypothetical protein
VGAAAAIPLRHHAAEALLEVDMPQGDMPEVAMLGLEWGRLELDGTALIGPARGTMAAIGTAPTMAVIGAAETTGMVVIGRVTTTGTAATVIGEIPMANGVGGTATGGVIPGTTWCSLAILAFRGGGVGAGALGQGAGAADTGDTPTVITATVTATAMAMAMDMATDTAPNTSLSTEIAANPESPSCNGGCHGLATTVDPSTESSGRKRGAQSGRTSKNMAT